MVRRGGEEGKEEEKAGKGKRERDGAKKEGRKKGRKGEGKEKWEKMNTEHSRKSDRANNERTHI